MNLNLIKNHLLHILTVVPGQSIEKLNNINKKKKNK